MALLGGALKVAVLCSALHCVAAGATTPQLPESGTTGSSRSDVDASIPEKYRQLVEQAQIQGLWLQQEDRAAWVSSDAVVEKGLLAAHPNATGWLASQQDADGNQWVVSFTEKGEKGQTSFVDVGVTLTPTSFRTQVQVNDPPRKLDDYQRFLAEYRDVALKSKDFLKCGERYNYSTSIFIDGEKKYFVIKLLPARMDDKSYPLGGFHEIRYPFSSGEKQVFSQTNSCIGVDASEHEPEAFVVSHLTSDTPTQFHVFMSLSYAKPMYVHTTMNDINWVVDSGKIRVLPTPAPKKKGTTDKPGNGTKN